MFANILIAAGVMMAVYGFFGLVGAWLVPSIGRSRLYGPRMLTGPRMKASRGNTTLMSLFALSLGCYFALSAAGYFAVSYAFFSVFLVCAITAMVIRYRHGSGA